MVAVRAGVIYFAAVFVLGVILGVLRTLVLVPRLGVLPAVAIELPVMLAASWLICGAVLRRLGVPARRRDLLTMAVVALALLWGAEALLALGMGLSLHAYLASLGTPAGALGMAAQLLFASFPLLRRRILDA